MNAKYIWEFGSLIFVVLGTIHLVYTFYSDKFSSKNQKVVDEMKSSHPKLTKSTTMWKAWIGFNASHSIGAIFIGLINIYLAHKYFSILQEDAFFFVFNIASVATYLCLAKKYWFRIPFYGILITLICYLVVFIMVA